MKYEEELDELKKEADERAKERKKKRDSSPPADASVGPDFLDTLDVRAGDETGEHEDVAAAQAAFIATQNGDVAVEEPDEPEEATGRLLLQPPMQVGMVRDSGTEVVRLAGVGQVERKEEEGADEPTKPRAIVQRREEATHPHVEPLKEGEAFGMEEMKAALGTKVAKVQLPSFDAPPAAPVVATVSANGELELDGPQGASGLQLTTEAAADDDTTQQEEADPSQPTLQLDAQGRPTGRVAPPAAFMFGQPVAQGRQPGEPGGPPSTPPEGQLIRSSTPPAAWSAEAHDEDGPDDDGDDSDNTEQAVAASQPSWVAKPHIIIPVTLLIGIMVILTIARLLKSDDVTVTEIDLSPESAKAAKVQAGEEKLFPNPLPESTAPPDAGQVPVKRPELVPVADPPNEVTWKPPKLDMPKPKPRKRKLTKQKRAAPKPKVTKKEVPEPLCSKQQRRPGEDVETCCNRTVKRLHKPLSKAFFAAFDACVARPEVWTPKRRKRR